MSNEIQILIDETPVMTIVTYDIDSMITALSNGNYRINWHSLLEENNDQLMESLLEIRIDKHVVLYYHFTNTSYMIKGLKNQTFNIDWTELMVTARRKKKDKKREIQRVVTMEVKISVMKVTNLKKLDIAIGENQKASDKNIRINDSRAGNGIFSIKVQLDACERPEVYILGNARMIPMDQIMNWGLVIVEGSKVFEKEGY